MEQPCSEQDPVVDLTQARWVRAYAEDSTAPSAGLWLDSIHRIGRPGSDSLAAWGKWHQGTCDKWFDGDKIVWYHALESARVECLTAAELPGAAANLKSIVMEPKAGTSGPGDLYRMARATWGLEFQCVSGRGHPPVSDWPSGMARFFNALLSGTRTDPARRILQSEEACAALRQAAGLLGDEQAFASVFVPLIERLAATRAPAEANQRVYVLSEEQTDDSDASAAQAGYEEDPVAESRSELGDYPIFRTQWDQCGPARNWRMPGDDKALAALNRLDRRALRRRARELQRRLLTQRLRHWDFEQEEGMLDSRRLASLVIDRPENRIFKVEKSAEHAEACVSLLVDQSGSMRGSAHLLAAQALDQAVHTMEICGIAVEVLGYTTRFGGENPVVECWKNAGRPVRPGRLNAIRHIVLKGAREPWRVARRNLGLMLRRDFGRENLDGESILWAARRLLSRPERNKILIVLSDGSPYDEATVQHNRADFLTSHLGAVVGTIEKSKICLIGIGAGRDVGRYYSRTATVRREDAIGGALFDVLGEALDWPIH